MGLDIFPVFSIDGYLESTAGIRCLPFLTLSNYNFRVGGFADFTLHFK